MFARCCICHAASPNTSCDFTRVASPYVRASTPALDSDCRLWSGHTISNREYMLGMASECRGRTLLAQATGSNIQVGAITPDIPTPIASSAIHERISSFKGKSPVSGSTRSPDRPLRLLDLPTDVLREIIAQVLAMISLRKLLLILCD